MAGGSCLQVTVINVVSAAVLLVQGDCKCPEIAEVVGMSTNHIEPDLGLEASKKGGSRISVRLKFSFEQELIEELCILADGAGLLQSGEELLLGPFLGIPITPLQLEVLLKGAPLVVMLLSMLGLCLIQLDLLPIGSLPTAQLEGPLDLDRVQQEM